MLLRFLHILIFSFLLLNQLAIAQLERVRFAQNSSIDLTFMASRHINVYTVQNLNKGEFHYSIMHTFGTVDAGYKNLWGIDNGANIRFSFEYGFSDDFSMAFGRSGFEKVYDLSARYHLSKQTIDDSKWFSLSFFSALAVATEDFIFINPTDSYSFADRLSLSGGAMIARKFNTDFSLQLTPTFAYFFSERYDLLSPAHLAFPDKKFYLGSAISGRYKITPRTALTFQFLPIIAEDKFHQNIALGYDIETGGHVFQLYLTTSQSLNDAYVLAGKNGDFLSRKFRIGFNINRLFMLGKQE